MSSAQPATPSTRLTKTSSPTRFPTRHWKLPRARRGRPLHSSLFLLAGQILAAALAVPRQGPYSGHNLKRNLKSQPAFFKSAAAAPRAGKCHQTPRERSGAAAASPSNYRSYARPADDGLSAWHPAYLRLGPTLDHCARSYEQFCLALSIRAEAEPSWPRWGGWRLWREISGKPAKGRVGDQADLFAAAGARYHGGPERRDGWRR
jgi:hypothetical protein